ncbi:MAG: glutathione S-transferase N-terminal domain-containing protein [Sneathiella sp.]
MKLCYSATSPFVRKVVVSAKEAGLYEKIETFGGDTSNIFKGINPQNPLGKVPSLTLESGDVLFDSVVICEYLNGLSESVDLFPGAGADRARVMTLHALADGMTDAAYQRRMDSAAMPEGEGSPSWNARLHVAMEKGLDELEKQAPDFKDDVNIGTIAVGCALGYFDFRFSAENWREGRPQLAAWYETFSARPSMQETVPPQA